MARVLIVGGEARGLRLAGDLLEDGHAVRVVVPSPDERERVEAIGAQCWIGTPERLATLRGALEHVTIACWLLACPAMDDELARALHGSRLEQFLQSAIDSTLRGFVYEAGGSLVDPAMLRTGARIVSETAARNSIPVELISADPLATEDWAAQARAAVGSLLAQRTAGGS